MHFDTIPLTQGKLLSLSIDWQSDVQLTACQGDVTTLAHVISTHPLNYKRTPKVSATSHPEAPGHLTINPGQMDVNISSRCWTHGANSSLYMQLTSWSTVRALAKVCKYYSFNSHIQLYQQLGISNIYIKINNVSSSYITCNLPVFSSRTNLWFISHSSSCMGVCVQQAPITICLQSVYDVCRLTIILSLSYLHCM